MGGPPSDAAALTRLADEMAATLAHRGPDDRGAWSAAQRVGLAQRRLAVIDLTPTGRQPMASRSGRWVVVFNGEIYNHLDIRRALSAAGARFDGTGDTETLVEAIDAWGVESTLTRLNGMFAIAAYDVQRDELWLVRDRLGEKPLYWTLQDNRLCFASELKGLRVVPGLALDICPHSVASVLRWSFIPHPHTIYRNVWQLAPGSLVKVVHAEHDRLEVEHRSWWSVEHEVSEARTRQPVSIDELDRLLEDAVAIRLLSDVPVGAFLSGGIDSSLVAAYAQRALGSSALRTFTMSMPDLASDEAAHASSVARWLGTDHHTLALSHADVQSLLGRLATMWDEPFADPSMVPTAMICAAVRNEVTVCLSGDGGDELFAGYNRHAIGGSLSRRLGALHPVVRRALSAAVGAVPPSIAGRAGDGINRLLPARRRLPDLGDKLVKARALMGAHADPWAALAQVWPANALCVDSYDPPFPPFTDPLEAMQFTDLATVLPDQMLVKTDRASMAASLEVRVPLIDHRVVRAAWSLPTDRRTSRGVGKLPLRELAGRHLPDAVASRPKHGFDPPMASWLRVGLRPWAADILASPSVVERGWLDGTHLQRAWDEHQRGVRNHMPQLWAVLMLELWLGEYASPSR